MRKKVLAVVLSVLSLASYAEDGFLFAFDWVSIPMAKENIEGYLRGHVEKDGNYLYKINCADGIYIMAFIKAENFKTVNLGSRYREMRIFNMNKEFPKETKGLYNKDIITLVYKYKQRMDKTFEFEDQDERRHIGLLACV